MSKRDDKKVPAVAGLALLIETGGAPLTPAQQKALEGPLRDLATALVDSGVALPARLSFLPAALSGPGLPDLLLPPERN